jgi:hypothetical protein
MSICAIEHFDDGPRSLAEMARVLPRRELSADAITRAGSGPAFSMRIACATREAHLHLRTARPTARRARLDLVEHTYQFRGQRAEHFYLAMSGVKGKAAPNAAVLSVPLVAASDRRAPNEAGSVVLIRARKRG